MIANISSGNSFYTIALYNQKKVDTGQARTKDAFFIERISRKDGLWETTLYRI